MTGTEQMSEPTFDPIAYIQVAAPLLGLGLDAERQAEVATFLGIARGMADILERAPVPVTSLDLAPVFVPAPPPAD